MSLSQSFSQKIGNVRPLNPCPSLDIDFANGSYVNTGGFANQESVGSANFKIGAFNGPDPIFARSSAATFRGSNGLIQYAPENLLPRSQEFDNAVWVGNRLNVTGTPTWVNATVAPDGTSTADFLIPDNISGNHRIRQINIATANVGYTLSFYAKANGYNYLGVQLASDTSFTKYFEGVFNLSNGSIESTGRAVSYSGSRSIENVGNGWYRCSITVNTVESNSTTIAGVVVQSTSDPTLNYTGNNTSGIYIWGAQLERSSTARPYISTTTAARYGPRFEYDLSGNPLGLLMEEQSENKLLYSEQFDNAYWTKPAGSITPNDAIAPNGTTTADKVVFSGANLEVKRQVVISGTTTASIYIKGTAGQTIAFSNGGVSPAVDVIHTLSGGWDRVVFTTTATNPYVSVNTYNSVTARTIHIWGAQLEQKPFVTSYMPTVGGTSTRNADVVSSTISSWFNQTEGTVVVSGDRNNNPTLNSSGLDSFFEFTGTASYLLVHACDGTTEAVYDAAGSPATTVGVTIGSLTSIAASYSDVTDLLHISRNGLATQSGPSTGLGVAPTTLNIGYAPVSLIGYWNGHIKSFRYFPKALPNNLQRLSS